MPITNNTLFPVIVRAASRDLGYTDDLILEPGESAASIGPFIRGDHDDEWWISVKIGSDISCVADPDTECGEYVEHGKKLYLTSGNGGVTLEIRHHLDLSEDFLFVN